MVTIDCVSTGAKLKRMATNKGMSYKDVQKLMGFNTPQAIYKWYRGDCMPTVDNLVLLAEAFNCSVDDLLVLRR